MVNGLGVKLDTPFNVQSARCTAEPLLPTRHQLSQHSSLLSRIHHPKIRLTYFRTPFKNVFSRIQLELTSNISRVVLWASLDKQVYLVIHKFQRKYIVPEVVD